MGAGLLPDPPTNEYSRTLGSQKASSGRSQAPPPNTERGKEKLIKVRFSSRIYSEVTPMRGSPGNIPRAYERDGQRPVTAKLHFSEGN